MAAVEQLPLGAMRRTMRLPGLGRGLGRGRALLVLVVVVLLLLLLLLRGRGLLVLGLANRPEAHLRRMRREMQRLLPTSLGHQPRIPAPPTFPLLLLLHPRPPACG